MIAKITADAIFLALFVGVLTLIYYFADRYLASAMNPGAWRPNGKDSDRMRQWRAEHDRQVDMRVYAIKMLVRRDTSTDEVVRNASQAEIDRLPMKAQLDALCTYYECPTVVRRFSESQIRLMVTNRIVTNRMIIYSDMDIRRK